MLLPDRLSLIRIFVALVFQVSVFIGLTRPVDAQPLDPRIGIGTEATINPLNNRLSNQLLGMGFRGRISMPINQEVSFVGGLGITGFILDGRHNAVYLANPELALVITLPLETWAPYIIGGISGFVPFGRESEGGPAIHGGVGWVRPLADTSVFLEINPALIIWERGTALILPLRAGIIL